MKDWNEKIDYSYSDAGIYYSDDANSLHKECKNVVEELGDLDEFDDTQLISTIDTLTKGLYYKDIGTVNNVVLTKTYANDLLNDYFDGLTMFFTPKYTNGSSVTLSLQGLAVRDVKNKGNLLTAGFLEAGKQYVVVYDGVNNWFNIGRISPVDVTNQVASTGDPNIRFKVASGILPKAAVNRHQLDLKLDANTTVNNLTSTATDRPIAVDKVRAMKHIIDLINPRLASSDVVLVNYQAIADYIKLNRQLLNSISINDVNGLQTALNGKSPKVHTHDTDYYLKTYMYSKFNLMTPVGGDVYKRFRVASATSNSHAVPTSQLVSSVTPSSAWDYISSYNPQTDTNPSRVGVTWKAIIDGTFFICTSNSYNNNTWVATDGQTVP